MAPCPVELPLHFSPRVPGLSYNVQPAAKKRPTTWNVCRTRDNTLIARSDEMSSGTRSLAGGRHPLGYETGCGT